MVNTFVTSTNLKECARNLDNLRLNKQIVEGKQIIKILETVDKTGKIPVGRGFVNHPATKMWMGHTNQLKTYVNHMIREWVTVRGKNHSVQIYPVDESKYNIPVCKFDGSKAVYEELHDEEHCFPKWFSFPPFIMAHKASLYRKNPMHYSFLLNEDLKPYIACGYLWPSKFPGHDYLHNWNMNYLAEIGTGAPVQYRYSQEEVRQWYATQDINPKTGRKIQSGGTLHKTLSKAYEFYYEKHQEIEESTLEGSETIITTATSVEVAHKVGSNDTKQDESGLQDDEKPQRKKHRKL
jgi:hypothetical protein